MPRQTKLRQALTEAFGYNIEPGKLDLAYRLMMGQVENDELKAIPAVAALINRCYSTPNRHHATMVALDSLLETHGCECIGYVDATQGPPVEYLNTGDAYTATVVHYRDLKQPWRIQCYADALEWLEKRRYRLDDT